MAIASLPLAEKGVLELLFSIMSSIIIALVFLSALAWKWNIRMKIAVLWAIVVGAATGYAAGRIDTAINDLNPFLLIILEGCIILFITFLIVIIRFYRDPERTPPETDKVILSPADGKVIYINEVEKGSALVSTKGTKKFELEKIAATNFLDNAAYLLGIDMNVLNVHVNRTPVSGKVILCKRTRGSFISLRKQESEIVNERVTTVIDNQTFKIGVIQISSRLVRRINTFIQEGENLSIGQRLGAIVFGSQVDVVINWALSR
jgi:phosphatidylserine decarboxylase